MKLMSSPLSKREFISSLSLFASARLRWLQVSCNHGGDLKSRPGIYGTYTNGGLSSHNDSRTAGAGSSVAAMME